ncbi:MAG: endolytic transglycosylase MltG, partial [Candidatus Firestonebacteria bacterium]
MKKREKTIKEKDTILHYLSTKNIIIAAIVFLLLLPFLPAGFTTKTKYLDVPKGYSASKISSLLKKESLIRSQIAFRALFYLRGGRMKAGEYEISPAMLPWNIISMLKNGKVVKHSVTIPEGFTVRQIAKLLGEKGLAREKRITELSLDKEFIAKCGIAASSLEGYLFPSTYFITKDMTEEDIL